MYQIVGCEYVYNPAEISDRTTRKGAFIGREYGRKLLHVIKEQQQREKDLSIKELLTRRSLQALHLRIQDIYKAKMSRSVGVVKATGRPQAAHLHRNNRRMRRGGREREPQTILRSELTEQKRRYDRLLTQNPVSADPAASAPRIPLPAIHPSASETAEPVSTEVERSPSPILLSSRSPSPRVTQPINKYSILQAIPETPASAEKEESSQLESRKLESSQRPRRPKYRKAPLVISPAYSSAKDSFLKTPPLPPIKEHHKDK